MLWGFISQYRSGVGPSDALLGGLVDRAIRYYRDRVKPSKRYRAPDEAETAALEDLLRELEALPASAGAKEIQFCVYEVGKRHPFPDLKAWFRALYEILFGQESGPRVGSFFELYGLENGIDLIRRVLAGQDLAAS